MLSNLKHQRWNNKITPVVVCFLSCQKRAGPDNIYEVSRGERVFGEKEISRSDRVFRERQM